jgi:hypothetical protein
MLSLDYSIIKAVMELGLKYKPGESVDPSTSKILSQAGTGMVTSYIEQLSLIALLHNPEPIFGADGGMWIAYQLTEKGRELAKSDDNLRYAVADLIGGDRSEISRSVRDLYVECKKSGIQETYRDDFLRTLEEIAICFDNACYIAVNSLCGKILEITLKEILNRNGIQFENQFTAGKLIYLVREKVPNEYVDESIMNILNVINISRNSSIHSKEKIPVPSRDQTIMVIFAVRDLLRRNLSHIN